MVDSMEHSYSMHGHTRSLSCMFTPFHLIFAVKAQCSHGETSTVADRYLFFVREAEY